MEFDKLVLKVCIEEQSFKNNLTKTLLNMMFSKTINSQKDDFIGLKLKTRKPKNYKESYICGKTIFLKQGTKERKIQKDKKKKNSRKKTRWDTYSTSYQ